jgi:hypothetical protein
MYSLSFGSKVSISGEYRTKSDIYQRSCPSHRNAERDGRKKYSPPRSTLKVSMRGS